MSDEHAESQNDEPECAACDLQDEAARPGTTFFVGDDLRSIYMVTPSGKKLPICQGIDFISADFMRNVLQEAWAKR